MGGAVGVDHGRFGVAAHPCGAEQMETRRRDQRHTFYARSACGGKGLGSALQTEVEDCLGVRADPVSGLGCGCAEPVLQR